MVTVRDCGVCFSGSFLYMDGSQSEADEESTFTIAIERQCAHTALFSYFLYGADVQPLTLLGVKEGKAQVLLQADKQGGQSTFLG